MSWSSHDAPRIRRRIVVPLAMAACVMAAAPASAQIVPRVEFDLRTIASGNPFLLPGSDRDAILFELTARPGLRYETPAGSSVNIGAVITERLYSRRYGDFLIGRLEATGVYRDSEFLSVTGYAAAARDLSVDLLTSSVEAGTDPTSIRTGFVGRVTANWRPNEYTEIVPEVSVDRTDYGRTGLLGDTRAFTASLGLRRRTGPGTTLGVRAGAVFSSTDRLSDTDTQFLYATIDRRLNTSWRLTAELGAERAGARTETLLGITAAQPARIRLSGRAELCREAPGPVICAGGALNSEVSGLGGLQRRAVATLSIDQRLDARTTLGLDAEYQRTVMQGDVFPAFDAIRAAAIVERTIRPNWRIGGTLQYLRRRLVDGSRIGAAFAGLQLTYAPVLR